jgi:hypothetical protein
MIDLYRVRDASIGQSGRAAGPRGRATVCARPARSRNGARYRHYWVVMRRIHVESSSIASVGYDAAEVTLEVEFVTGRVYRYIGVPAWLHDAFLAAPSKGQFFNTLIRDRYIYDEITRDAGR